MSVVIGPLIQLLTSIVISVLITVGLVPDDWSKTIGFSAAIAISLFVFLTIRLLVVSPMYMWKEGRDKVGAYEVTDLSFYYDDANASCKRDKYLGDGQLGERLWRVGIKGSEGTLIKGVIIQLEAIEPSIDDLPQALHPMKALWKGGPTEWEGDGSFDIRPGATEYVDVIRYQPSHGQESSRLEIVLQSYAKSTPFRTQTLTLSAQGQQGPRLTKRFQLEVNPDNLTRFYPLDVSVSSGS